MNREATTVNPSPEFTETLIIRLAVPADAPALRRLAQLDSAPPPEQVPMLVAVADGDLCAALPLSGGTAVANPFRRTEEIVAMLRARAEQLGSDAVGPSPAADPSPGTGAGWCPPLASVVAPHVARRPSPR